MCGPMCQPFNLNIFKWLIFRSKFHYHMNGFQIYWYEKYINMYWKSIDSTLINVYYQNGLQLSLPCSQHSLLLLFFYILFVSCIEQKIRSIYFLNLSVDHTHHCCSLKVNDARIKYVGYILGTCWCWWEHVINYWSVSSISVPLSDFVSRDRTCMLTSSSWRKKICLFATILLELVGKYWL